MTDEDHIIERLHKELSDRDHRIEELRLENRRLNKELSLKYQADAVQIIDALYSRAGFDHWWGDLTQDLKEEVLEGITEVLKR